jgi:hypothetical protein
MSTRQTYGEGDIALPPMDKLIKRAMEGDRWAVKEIFRFASVALLHGKALPLAVSVFIGQRLQELAGILSRPGKISHPRVSEAIVGKLRRGQPPKQILNDEARDISALQKRRGILYEVRMGQIAALRGIKVDSAKRITAKTPPRGTATKDRKKG